MSMVNYRGMLAIKRYVITLIIATALFAGLSTYLFLRRGFYDLYIANKVFAGVAFILLATVLLIGSLTRLYQRFDQLILYRKEFGIGAFVLAFIHGFVSFFNLPDHFPVSYFQKNIASFLFGLTSLIIITTLFIYSFSFAINTIERKKWWKLQNWGVRFAGLLILLHVLPMKYAGWMRWYISGGAKELLRPYLPPAGLLVVSFAIFVLGVRLAEFTGQDRARKLVRMIVALYVLFLTGTFFWGKMLK